MTDFLYIVNVEGVVYRQDRYLMIVRSAAEDYAAGALAFPGGKVEGAGVALDILEETLRREIREEVGIEVSDISYMNSSAFIANDNQAVVDVVFLCHYLSGTATPGNPDEVAGIHWLTADEILARSDTPPWIARSLIQAEELRCSPG